MKTVCKTSNAESKELKIVMIEDVLGDVELVESELRKGGLGFRARQVQTREAFLHELQHDPPDVILSDHGLPSFDGFAALAITQDRCPDVPFIFVSGHLGEENAIKAFEDGAADCVLKHRLSNLVPAVLRALRRTKERRRHEANQLLPICAHCKRIRDAHSRWQMLELYFRLHCNIEFTHGLCPECVPVFFPGQLARK